MSGISTEGIVLHSKESGEGDVYSQILTEHYGLITGIFKGLKKSTRRYPASSEQGTLSQFVLSRIVEDKPVIIQETTMIDLHAPIRKSLKKIIHLNYLVEIILKTAPFNTGDSYLFRMLRAALVQLESCSLEYHLAAFFSLHLLRLHGILPDFTCCASCKNSSKDDYHFSITERCLLCPVCARIDKHSFLKISERQRTFANECLSNKFSACNLRSLNEDESSGLLFPLVNYLEQYFHTEILSKPFLFSDDLLDSKTDISC
jgi:DNA repair protein RecO (recombination protein O)